MEIPRASENSNVFRAKKMTLIQYSQRASKGIIEKMTATTPVPIVVANHDGEKLRTTRRQPWSFLDGAFVGAVVGSDEVASFGLGCCEAAFTSPLSPF